MIRFALGAIVVALFVVMIALFSTQSADPLMCTRYLVGCGS